MTLVAMWTLGVPTLRFGAFVVAFRLHVWERVGCVLGSALAHLHGLAHDTFEIQRFMFYAWGHPHRNKGIP